MKQMLLQAKKQSKLKSKTVLYTERASYAILKQNDAKAFLIQAYGTFLKTL